MAASSTTSPGLVDDSFDTALCFILPDELRASVDHFRSLNDKAYMKWPPHINLIYPFVHPNDLEQAAEILAAQDWSGMAPVPVALDDVGAFAHKKQNTIVLRPAPEGASHGAVKSSVCHSRLILGLKPKDHFNPHLTVAQSEDSNSDLHRFLLDKAHRLAPIAWEAGELALMIRNNKGTSDESMKPWGTIDMRTGIFSRCRPSAQPVDEDHGLMPWHSSTQVWQPASALLSSQSLGAPLSTPTDKNATEPIDRLVVASYNVLAEFEWPPSRTRFPQLVSNLLSQRGAADILVLQEVNDDFLDHLLSEDGIRSKYPYTTHKRPSDPGNGPLPSLLNVVVLSRFPMTWRLLHHQRKHKHSVVVRFNSGCGPIVNSSRQPLVLVGVHLSQGLNDGAVATKKQEIQEVLQHLRLHHSNSPCIIAGDLNLTTSAYTLRMAVEKGSISIQGVQKLRNTDHMFKENGFDDTWLSTRLRTGESSSVATHPRNLSDEHEGEQGATFDPLSNTQGIRQTGGGLNNRPQRYDRIYVNRNCELQAAGFNTFGQDATAPANDEPPEHASDHWGVRCLLQRRQLNEPYGLDSAQLSQLCKAQPSLGEMNELKQCLAERGLLPTQADEEARLQVISGLRRVLVEEIIPPNGSDQRSRPALVLVPVGSTALGVWTSQSDVDCLCIGSISSRTFFTLALRRLRKAAADNIRILRKVRANTGTMLELKVQGIRVDLQYCPAISIAEQYPKVLDKPPNDPAFALPMQTLLKLKAARDVAYLRRSIPDMAQYRAAHIFIKAWAQSRGIYAPKFGFLGGIHISVLLVPICKLMAQDGGVFSVSDILLHFFDRYTNCDWSKEMVMDPLFHKNIRYHRSFREPMCLLGWHAPSLNTAAAASTPTVNVIAKEFARANALAQQVDQTWQGFLNEGDGVREFLTSYKAYIKIELHYWGTGKETGNKFLGWFESRCPSILVDLHNRIPTLMPRIWPQRLVSVEKAATWQPVELIEYRGQHLIGLGWQDPPFKNSSNVNPSEQRKATEANLIALLPQLEARIQNDETYYDPRSCWVHFSLVRGSELDAMEVDRSEWGADLVTDDKWSDEEDLEDETEEDDDEEAGHGDDQYAKAASSDAETGPAGGVDPSRATNAMTPGLGKFRTATDVLNRLRWDASMDSNNFIVGYEDRFVGAREKALIHWKSELTHEEFIPQHRILYFKRRSDDRKVWERSTRTDEIFGSGFRCDTDPGTAV